ncbi:ribosome biogenesis GTP-binding protein YihA/YsxC [Candidatus Profftia lariciata]|uniref:ribosome biogenesis GTP-binding protein YihA/YsxC n=1 Tax=Candidatus Profftia lariciata TaxID=1987921 RepID=UPI001D007937|nr:ribosome biogenesis GTP-binding protein YihA/YsxC [Candidatus Profftia lariciata]
MLQYYNYHITRFVTSSPNIRVLLSDTGVEVAFAGRSNAGKSSALNTLTNQKLLARTSRNPGSTILINQFEVTKGIRLIDLPGYGYSKMHKNKQHQWLQELRKYIYQRDCLKGIVLLMDIRHPLNDLDQKIIQWSDEVKVPIMLLLAKADKLNYIARQIQLNFVRKEILPLISNIQVEVFSSLKKIGVDKLSKQLNIWFSSSILSTVD